MKIIFRMGTDCVKTRKALEALYPEQVGAPLFEVDADLEAAFKKSKNSMKMELSFLSKEETKEVLSELSYAVHELHNTDDLKSKVRLLALVNEVKDLIEILKG